MCDVTDIMATEPAVTRSPPPRYALALPGSPSCAIAIGALIAALIQSNLAMTLLTQAVITGILATGVGFLIRQNGAV